MSEREMRNATPEESKAFQESIKRYSDVIRNQSGKPYNLFDLLTEEDKREASETIYRLDAIEAVERCVELYMNNLRTMIYKEDAIKALKELPSVINTASDYLDDNGRYLWSARQPETKQPCDLCKSLERGDTLYQSSSWDGGVGYDYIWDIQYCPKCGRRLDDG